MKLSHRDDAASAAQAAKGSVSTAQQCLYSELAAVCVHKTFTTHQSVRQSVSEFVSPTKSHRKPYRESHRERERE